MDRNEQGSVRPLRPGWTGLLALAPVAVVATAAIMFALGWQQWRSRRRPPLTSNS